MTEAMEAANEVQLSYVDISGKNYEIRAVVGSSLMVTAKTNLVQGIDGDCGGNAACGTCLTRIDRVVHALLSPPSADELDLLDGLGVSHGEYRLGCQIPVTHSLIGCTFHVGQPA